MKLFESREVTNRFLILLGSYLYEAKRTAEKCRSQQILPKITELKKSCDFQFRLNPDETESDIASVGIMWGRFSKKCHSTFRDIEHVIQKMEIGDVDYNSGRAFVVFNLVRKISIIAGVVSSCKGDMTLPIKEYIQFIEHLAGNHAFGFLRDGPPVIRDCEDRNNVMGLTKMNGWICGPRIYRFEGWLFERPSYGQPWPIKEDGTQYKRAGRVFWKMIQRFERLPSDEARDKFREGGGCVLVECDNVSTTSH